MDDKDIAAWVYALRLKAQTPDKFNGRRSSTPQLKRLYTFIGRALKKPSLRKVMLQVLTGKPLMDDNGKVSGFQLGMGYASLLITELEVGDGVFGSMLLATIEERLEQQYFLCPWNLFDSNWLQANMPDLRGADTHE